MSDPVERLEQWCDEQEARQMRPGQSRPPAEFWPTVDMYRRIIGEYRSAKADHESSGDSYWLGRADQALDDISRLAEALHPEEK